MTAGPDRSRTTGAPAGAVVAGALVLALPLVPGLLAGTTPVESAAVRVLLAILVSWAGCELVWQLVTHYTATNGESTGAGTVGGEQPTGRRRDDENVRTTSDDTPR